MAWPIHEKIQRILAERKARKKTLAAHLGIAPQTMTDICKGRSAVTLAHLKGIVRFFGIRADFWLDDTRRDPHPSDLVESTSVESMRELEELGILGSASWPRILARLRRFVHNHRAAWVREFGPIDADESRFLGLPLHERAGQAPPKDDAERDPFAFLEERGE